LTAISTPSAVRTGSLSLFEGGPTHRLMVRAGLAKKRLPELIRGAIVLATFAWLPMLLFAASEGLAVGGVPVPFLLDFGAHARLLVAVPLLITMEAVIGPRLPGAAAHLLERGIVAEDDVARFDGAVGEALRLRDSATLEVAALLLAYVGSFLSLALQFFVGSSTWDLLTTATGFRLTSAGIWNTFVAIPLYQFLLYRTFTRLFIWWRLLWAVSRLDLRLIPTHPDRAGGLGFLGGAHRPLGLVAVAVGTVLSGRYCTEILYQSGTLATLKAPVAGYVAVMVLVCFGPLVMFMPKLMAARRVGLREYGALAYRYATDFDRKWVRGQNPEGEALLGSGDIQSLADMGGSFERIEQMRPVPFGWKDVTSLVVTALVPMIPVLATAMPIEEVVRTVLKIVG
jgi:hypothetical protein